MPNSDETTTVRVLNESTRKLITQLPGATILPDGRVQFNTTKGVSFLVCGEACVHLGVDPNIAALEDVGQPVYYQVGQPLYGKVVEVGRHPKQKLKTRINPEWQRYNDTMNEGGDGYVPSSIPKYIAED